MAYIAPNSSVRIMRNVPLSPDYIHTLDFDNELYQSAYFTTKQKYALENYSYQRKTNSIKVNIAIENLYDCNYLAYKNNSFENKWFYAFIINIEYVSNVVSEIFFEEDVIQTWMFDYTLNSCFVVREHTLDDSITKNLEPENFELGDYVYNFKQTYTPGFHPAIIGACVYDFSTKVIGLKDNTQTSSMGYYYPLNIIYCMTNAEAGEALNAIINAGYESSILAIRLLPPEPFNSQTGNYSPFVPTRQQDSLSFTYTNINGYTPKNNKLYHYPYHYIQLSNGVGQTSNIQIEYLTDPNKFDFSLYMDIMTSFSISLVPHNYKGANLATEEAVTLANLPELPRISDSYALWYAQNCYSYPTQIENMKARQSYNTINTVGQGLFSTARGMAESNGSDESLANLAINGIETGYNALMTMYSNKLDLNEAARNYLAEKNIAFLNSRSCVYTESSLGKFFSTENALHIYEVSITAEMARKIDSYFSAYGYAVNRFKVPETKGRRNWNYVKTSGCDAVGSIPQYAIQAINHIFNTGITFWHNTENIGNYDVNNDIIGLG